MAVQQVEVVKMPGRKPSRILQFAVGIVFGWCLVGLLFWGAVIVTIARGG